MKRAGVACVSATAVAGLVLLISTAPGVASPAAHHPQHQGNKPAAGTSSRGCRSASTAGGGGHGPYTTAYGISLQGPSAARSGSEVTYYASTGNKGPYTAPNLVVHGAFASCVTVLSIAATDPDPSRPPPSCAKLPCAIGDLQPGSGPVLAIRVRLPARYKGTVDNAVFVTSDYSSNTSTTARTRTTLSASRAASAPTVSTSGGARSGAAGAVGDAVGTYYCINSGGSTSCADTVVVKSNGSYEYAHEVAGEVTRSGNDLTFSGTLADRGTAKFDALNGTITFDYTKNGVEYYFVFERR